MLNAIIVVGAASLGCSATLLTVINAARAGGSWAILKLYPERARLRREALRAGGYAIAAAIIAAVSFVFLGMSI